MSGPTDAPARILIADDEDALARVIAQHLGGRGHAVTVVAGGSDALAALRRESFDVALLDIVMPSPDGLEVLRAVHDDVDRPEIVIMTGNGSIDTAVQAMRLGAFAYLSKPYRMAELDVVVARALERRQLSHENAQLRARLERSELVRPLDTNYAPLRAVLEVAHRAAAGSASILLTGPAGVGKYALAQELHRASARGRGPFVALSAAQLRGADAARLLFGRAARDGAVVESAALSTTGTLYLGDLGALSAVLQTRLLRALSVGEFRAEAGATLWPVRARIIAATRESPDDPASKVQPELVARLGGVRLTIPALAERPDDIERLATTFVHASSGGSVTLAPDAVAMLRAHRWPGNAAELRTVLTGVLAQCRSDTITAGDLTVEASSTTPLVEVERRHIAAVLGAADWHQGRAAEILGISPKTLYRKIREYGLHRPRSGARA